jgi:hypothetical protein
MRPDRWGIIIDTVNVPGETHTLLYIWECIEGRYADPDIQLLIRDFVETGPYVISGRTMQGEHDVHFPKTMAEEDRVRFLLAAVRDMDEKQEIARAGGG